MTPRTKCPIARRAVGGPGCQRPGCECMTGKWSRLCACCLRSHSETSYVRGAQLKRDLLHAVSVRRIAEVTTRLASFESELLAEFAGWPALAARKVPAHPSCWWVGGGQ